MYDDAAIAAFESKFLISRRLPPIEIEYRDSEHHLILRPFYPSDLKVVEPAIAITLPRLIKFIGWPVQEWNEKNCLIWLTQKNSAYFGEGEVNWGCFDTKGNMLACISLMQPIPANPYCWDGGNWAVAKAAKKGVIETANRVSIAIGFECFEVRRFQILIMYDNRAAIRGIKTTGFLHEGIVKGLYTPLSKRDVAAGKEEKDIAHVYALVYSDYIQVPWRQEILNRTQVTSLSNKKFQLSELANFK